MKLAHVVLAITISMIWGVNFVAAKAATGYFPTFFLLAMRLTIVSAILFPFIRKPAFPIKKLFKISVTVTLFHFGFMFLSLEHGLDAAVAVVVDQLRVPFAVTLGYFVLGETIARKGILGIVLALAGTFIIVGTPNITENYIAFLMLIAGTASWAVYNIQIKNLTGLNVLSFIGWISILGMPQLYIISFIVEKNQIALLLETPYVVIASLLYLSIAATIFAHGCWYYLLQHYPVNIVVPYTLLVPVFGMAAGILLLNEELTWQIVAGGILTIAGVAIVVIKKPKAAKGGDLT